MADKSPDYSIIQRTDGTFAIRVPRADGTNGHRDMGAFDTLDKAKAYQHSQQFAHRLKGMDDLRIEGELATRRLDRPSPLRKRSPPTNNRPVAVWDGEPKKSSVDHDSVYDEL